MLTNAQYRHLRACYAAACAQWHRAAPGRFKELALESANRLWDEVATEVSLRNIVAMFRARRRAGLQ